MIQYVFAVVTSCVAGLHCGLTVKWSMLCIIKLPCLFGLAILIAF